MEIKFDTVSYTDTKSRLNDVSFSFYSKHIYGIVGSNGSGKSYLGKLIYGMIRQTSGEITIDNEIIKTYSSSKKVIKCRDKIGYVGENPTDYFLYSTVYDTLKTQILKYHYREDESEKRINDALKMIRLPNKLINRHPLTLSSGEQKKLLIAMALIHNPEVLVLDEPTIGLDPREQKNIHKLIRMLKNRYGKTIIIITNDIEFLFPIVDDLLVLDKGNLIYFDKKYEVIKNVRQLKKIGVDVPTTIYFSDLVLRKKKIKLGYRDQMNDLIKDIYRYSTWGKREKENE